MWALVKFVAFVLGIIAVFSVGFYVLMERVEGKTYSWITSVYWTLSTMSTLGYGDVVFESEIGQLYSLVVLMGGIVTIFIVFPFTFIRFLYQPWLEAQIRRRTPREVPAGMEGHVILCGYNPMAAGLIDLLERERIPHYVLEPDRDRASEEYFAGIPVVVGDVEQRTTYEALRVGQARLVCANLSDELNVNITLTVREVEADVMIVAIAHQEHAVEVLKRSGATYVLPISRWLGEQLASRVNAGHTQAHVIGRYQDLCVAELPVHHTPLVGQTIRETKLREHIGVSIVGVWERGRLQPADPDRTLTEESVPVLVGTEAQLADLDFMFAIYDVNEHPAVVVGAGDAGQAAVRALHRRGVPVALVEQDPAALKRLRGLCRHPVLGDAMDPDVLRSAGIDKAPAVLLTTTSDALNIFIASQCRVLNPDLRIISRITHEHNIEAIHHAGADFVLGSASLGVETAFAILKRREIVVLGEGVDLVSMPLPPQLEGQTLAGSQIGARTGLNVIALQHSDTVTTNPPASTVLEKGMELVMLGSVSQQQRFMEEFSL